MSKKLTLLAILFTVFCSLSTAYAMGGPAPSTEEVEIIERIAIQTEEAEAKEEYEMKVLMEMPWGSGPGQLGIGGGGEVAFGPSRLVVDGEGNIYIFDTANNRIQKFSKNGEFVKAIPVDSLSVKEVQGRDYPEINRNDRDMGIDEEGELYVLNVKDKEIRKIDDKGKAIKRYSVPSNISSFAVSKKDSFVIRRVEKGLIRNMGLEGGKYEEGIETPSGMRVVLEPQTEDNKQYIKIINRKGELIKRVEIKEKYRIWKVRYKGTDKWENIYLYVERLVDEYITGLIGPNTYKKSQNYGNFIYKFNNEGLFLTSVRLDAYPGILDQKVAQGTIFEDSYVDNQGNIYLLVRYGDIYNEAHPTPRSFKVFKWEKVSQ